MTEMDIHFCPWCGVPLHRFYRQSLPAMFRPRLRIPEP